MKKQTVRQQIAVIDAIAEARKKAGLSQRALSARLHQAESFIQRIERGIRDVTVAEFIAIARALDVEPDELLRRSLR